MKALGMIETIGMVGAIEALDVALKTANVNFLNRHFVKGGIVTVEIVGDVGAVKVAVESATEATKRMGIFVSSHVIARPDESTYSIIKKEEEIEFQEETKEVAKEKIEIQEQIEEKETSKEDLGRDNLETEPEKIVEITEGLSEQKEIKAAKKETKEKKQSKQTKDTNKKTKNKKNKGDDF